MNGTPRWSRQLAHSRARAPKEAERSPCGGECCGRKRRASSTESLSHTHSARALSGLCLLAALKRDFRRLREGRSTRSPAQAPLCFRLLPRSGEAPSRLREGAASLIGQKSCLSGGAATFSVRLGRNSVGDTVPRGGTSPVAQQFRLLSRAAQNRKASGG